MDTQIDALARHFLLSSRRAHVLAQLRAQVPLIPSARAAHLVPLFGAHDLDVVLEYTFNNTRGFSFTHGLQVGGAHGELSDDWDATDELEIAAAGGKKKKKGRTMYAETARELEMLATQIKSSKWNARGPCVSVNVGSVDAEAVVQEGK